MIDYKDLFQQIMYIVITAVLPIALAYLKSFLDAKANEAIANVENKKFAGYLARAYEAVGLAVNTVSQTYVDSIKQSGNFDKEAQEKAKEMAIEIAKELISYDVKQAINIAYGDFDTYLNTAIESYVRETKNGMVAVPNID